MGLRCVDPPCILHSCSETALWATRWYGSALCRLSPHSPLSFGDSLVGHAVAWVCVVQTLPTFSALVWRWPCGPLGGIGLRHAGLPRTLRLPFCITLSETGFVSLGLGMDAC